VIERPPPTLYLHFSIAGEFDPQLVSQGTGLSPNRTWRKGDRMRRGRRVASEDYWDLRIGPVEDSQFDPHLRSLLAAVIPHSRFLTALRSSGSVTFTITLSIWTPEHPLSYAPVVFVESQLLSQVTSLGANLSIDLNLLADDDSETEDP
jgi:Domain of unknown function (DUF4279)